MRIGPLLLASALAVAVTTEAAAKPKGTGGMGGFGGIGGGADFGRGRGSASSAAAVRPWQNESHPAYWAPGHVKKRNGAASARLYAPSRARRETYLPPGQRFH